MDLERRRGITIRAAVTSFALDDLDVNIVDTPGHPDFIAEVERSLVVLDAAVLVLSSVEGVQPQTVVIWRALQRIGVPTVLFVNKVDRAGRRRRPGRRPGTSPADAGRRRAGPARRPGAARRPWSGHPVRRPSRSSRRSPRPTTGCWRGGSNGRAGSTAGTCVRGAAARSAPRRRSTPVVCGSAITGAGVPELRRVLTQLLPRAEPRPGPLAGTVFAVDRDERGRRAWVRVWSGEVRVRDRVAVRRAGPPRAGHRGGGQRARRVDGRADRARPGQIAAVRGPSARIGDTRRANRRARRAHRFAPATLQALVEPEDPTRRTALFAGLAELADEDPLIDLRLDEADGEAAVSLHGEVQKEVVAALLEERYGVRARFSDTSVVCIERVVGTRRGRRPDRGGRQPLPRRHRAARRGGAGRARHRVLARHRAGQAAAGVRRGHRGGRAGGTAPGPARLGGHRLRGHDDGVRLLRRGRAGRTRSSTSRCRASPPTSATSPRWSWPPRCAQAGTRVCQPIDRFELELPDEAFGPSRRCSAGSARRPLDTSARGGYTRLVGHLPSAGVPAVAARLPDLTGGEGVLVTRLDHHAPVADAAAAVAPPPRPRPARPAAWFRQTPR